MRITYKKPIFAPNIITSKIMRVLFIFVSLACSMPIFAQSKDSISTQHINEVVVTAKNHIAIKDGVAYIPTPEERKSSYNYAALLSRMMVAGLRVDEFTNKVETTWGKEVNYFINGLEASEWEIKKLRPKEVARMEYLQSPTDPKFKNYTAVVNFVLREYDYGGYVMAEANQGFGNNNYGDYDIAGKLKKGHMTYQATIGGYYKDTHENRGNTDVTYIYNDGHKMNKRTDDNGTNKQDIYSTNFSARYDSKKLVWQTKIGLRFNKIPNSRTTENVFYNDEAAGTSIIDVSSQSLSPYIYSQIIIYGLPHKSYLLGSLSFSYNHNKGNNNYLLTADEQQSIFNKTRENSYLPSLTLSYYLPISKKSSLVCKTDFNTEIYRTNYYGTADTYQKLINSYYSFDLKYSYRFSNNWKGNLAVKMPIQSYKVQDDPAMTKVYLNGSMTLNGKINQRHSIYIEANITQSAINPSYYNTVVRQDDEFTGSKGNADLKTVRQAFALASHTWMPNNTFSLNSSFSWDNIINDIVPYWHEIDGLMVKEMINSGSFNPIYLNVTPSVSFMNGKLRISSNVSYVHEWHNGLFHVNNGYWGWYPSAYCSLGKYWAVNLNYAYSSGKGYMRGSSKLSEFSNNFKLGVQFTKGNLFMKLQVNSLFLKNGYIKSWLISENINNYTYTSRPWDRRYVSLSASYTIDYGKKISHGSNLNFGGKTKTSVL